MYIVGIFSYDRIKYLLICLVLNRLFYIHTYLYLQRNSTDFCGFISKLSSVSFENVSVTSSLRSFAALVRSCLPTCQNGPIGRTETSVKKTTNQSCVTTRKTSAIQWRKPEISHGSFLLLLPTVHLCDRMLGII